MSWGRCRLKRGLGIAGRCPVGVIRRWRHATLARCGLAARMPESPYAGHRSVVEMGGRGGINLGGLMGFPRTGSWQSLAPDRELHGWELIGTEWGAWTQVGGHRCLRMHGFRRCWRIPTGCGSAQQMACIVRTTRVFNSLRKRTCTRCSAIPTRCGWGLGAAWLASACDRARQSVVCGPSGSDGVLPLDASCSSSLRSFSTIAWVARICCSVSPRAICSARSLVARFSS